MGICFACLRAVALTEPEKSLLATCEALFNEVNANDGGFCTFGESVDKGEARFFFLALKAVLTNNPNPPNGVWSSNDLAQRILDEVKAKVMEGGEFKAISKDDFNQCVLKAITDSTKDNFDIVLEAFKKVHESTEV